jgi:hypothetical protein
MVTVFLGGENQDGDVKIIVPILLMDDDLRHLPDEEGVSLPVGEAGRSYHHLNTQAAVWIRIRYLRSIRIRIRIQEYNEQICKIFVIFFL